MNLSKDGWSKHTMKIPSQVGSEYHCGLAEPRYNGAMVKNRE